MVRELIGLAACTAALMLPLAAAHAQDGEKLIGRYKQWSAMQYEEGGQRICVMWSDPEKQGRLERGQEPHAFVSHRSGDKVFDEISIQIGVALKTGSSLVASIGSQRFTLYVDGDSAWNPSLREDKRMVRAMRAGRSLRVTATSASGARIEDQYSLFGFTDAHRSIGKACRR